MFILGGIGAAMSAAAGVVGAVCSAVTTIATAIGGAVAKVANGIVLPLFKLPFEVFEKVVSIIGAVIGAIAEELGLIEKEEEAEEIGMKAEIAYEEDHNIRPENFDSYEAYINHLRENIQIDKERIENLSKEDRLKYTVIGSTILTKGIEEKVGFDIPSEFIVEIGKQNLSIAETKEYIKTFKNEDLDLKDFSSFLNGTIDKKEYAAIGNAIESAIKNLNPNITENEIDDKITNMKDTSRK